MKSQRNSIPLDQAHYFLLAVLALCIIACYRIVQPYLHPIVLALILSTVFHPVHARVEKRLANHRNAAAVISCTLLTFVVVLPLMLMLIAIIGQGVRSFNAIYDWIAGGGFQQLLETPLVTRGFEMAERHMPNVKKVFPQAELSVAGVSQSLLHLSSEIGRQLISHGGHLVGNLTSLVISFFLMIFVFFFAVRDHDRIFAYVLHLIPLSSSQENQILNKIRAVSRSALLGTLVTAALQGVAGGLAFWICNLPGLFWGAAMAFASLIPVVGTALIWVPATAYLFLTGHWGLAIFMLVWCVVVVGMIDNLVRPLFMQGSADMSTLLIFFAILGGIQAFGLVGILYGPLVFGLTMVLLYIYSLEFEEFLKRQDRS